MYLFSSIIGGFLIEQFKFNNLFELKLKKSRKYLLMNQDFNYDILELNYDIPELNNDVILLILKYTNIKCHVCQKYYTIDFYKKLDKNYYCSKCCFDYI